MGRIWFPLVDRMITRAAQNSHDRVEIFPQVWMRGHITINGYRSLSKLPIKEFFTKQRKPQPSIGLTFNSQAGRLVSPLSYGPRRDLLTLSCVVCCDQPPPSH